MRPETTMGDPQLGHVLEIFEESLRGHSGPVAIGLDMAASEDNWGLSVLLVDADHNSARLSLVLPRARLNRDGSPAKKQMIRPTLSTVRRVLQLARDRRMAGTMAVDIPFGWPEPHRQFVNGWSASTTWKGNEAMPSSEEFGWRWCDRLLAGRPGERRNRIRPLAVGGDKIAQAAFRWAEIRADLGDLTGAVDFGLEVPLAEFCTIETYPAAFVQLVTPEIKKYKSQPKVRQTLLPLLTRSYDLRVGKTEGGWLDWACKQKGSPDAFDSLLCALAAWDHLRWRAEPDSYRITTPEQVLERLPTDEEAELIRAEGWILVRASVAAAAAPRRTVG